MRRVAARSRSPPRSPRPAAASARAPPTSARRADDGKTKICMMPKLVGIPYFNATERGAQDAARELGVELDYNGPTEAAAVAARSSSSSSGSSCAATRSPSPPTTPTRSRPRWRRPQRAGMKTGAWDADVAEGARSASSSTRRPSRRSATRWPTSWPRRRTRRASS